MTEKRIPTSEKVNNLIKITKIYLETAEKSGVILWMGSATTTNGVATFYPTDDGTISGTALFTNIFSVQAVAEKDTIDPEEVPVVSIKSLSGDNKTLTINVIIAAAPKTIFTPDLTKVDVIIIGN